MTSLDTPASAVDTQLALDALFTAAHTARAFAADPVTPADIAAVHEAVKWGPTAINSQPLRLLLVQSPEARQRLATHMMGANAEAVLAAPMVIVAAADLDFHTTMGRFAPWFPGVDGLEAAGPDGRAPMATLSTMLQVGYWIIGLRAHGFDVGPMTGMDAAGVTADLLAGTSWSALTVLVVGRPTEGAYNPRGERHAFEEMSRTI